MALKYLKPHVFLANEAAGNLQLACMVPLQNEFTNVATTEQTIANGSDRVLQVNFNFTGLGAINEHVYSSVQPIILNVAAPQNIIEISVSKEGIEEGKIGLDINLAFNGALDDFAPCSFFSQQGNKYEFSCLINVLNGYRANGFNQHYSPMQDNNINVAYVADGSINTLPLSYNGLVEIDNDCIFIIKGDKPPLSKIRHKNIF